MTTVTGGSQINAADLMNTVTGTGAIVLCNSPTLSENLTFNTLTLSTVSVHINSSQILNMGTTPITLLAAPGTGLLAIPISITLQYKYGTTAYTDHGAGYNPIYGTNPATNSLVPYILTGLGFIDQTSSQIFTYGIGMGVVSVDQPQGYVQTNAVNAAISLAQVNGHSTDPTGGNGTMVATMYYYIFTVS